MLFKRKDEKKKEKLIAKYTKLLEESINDEQTFALANGIAKYHKDFELDPKLIKQNGILRTTYHYYVADRNVTLYRLNSASTEKEIKELEERLNADNMYLTEISGLIIEYENAKSRKRQMEKLEKYFTEDEINLIKITFNENQQANNNEESLKR